MSTINTPSVESPVRESGLWKIYDALSEDIRQEEPIDAFVAGLHWFGLRSGTNVGLAMSPGEVGGATTQAGTVTRMSLQNAARLAKSWNLADAALGLAAINSHWNTPFRIQSMKEDPGLVIHCDGSNVFDMMASRIAGSRVAVIGHFRGLDKLKGICELSIIERRPQPGDLPDPACEDILPRSDFVFITGTTLINKTLPRLLELSRRAYVTLVGPSTPLSPLLFDHGIDLVAGLVVDDHDSVWKVVQEGGQHSLFAQGTRMVQFERKTRRLGRRQTK